MNDKKVKRRKPSTNLTIAPHVREAAAEYKKRTGRSLSELAGQLLSDFLEAKGYLSTRHPQALRIGEKSPTYGKKNKP